MDINKVLRADYLDIIFEGRNKAYGGYELRKKYGRRSRRAGVIVVASVILLSGIPTLASMMGKSASLPAIIERKIEIANLPVMPNKEVVPPTPPPPPAREFNPPPAIAATVPTIVDDKDVEQPAVSNEDMRKNEVSVTTAAGTGRPGDEIAPMEGGIPGGTAIAQVAPIREAPHTIVDQAPHPDYDLSSWLAAHLHYPEAAREAGIEGRTVVEFIVNEDGSIDVVRVARNAAAMLDAEAMRVVKMMPKWQPGKINGKAVRTYFNLPVIFTLD